MIELKKLRKPREKHFLKSDKTMVAYVYDYDIHYLKDGKYHSIISITTMSFDIFIFETLVSLCGIDW